MFQKAQNVNSTGGWGEEEWDDVNNHLLCGQWVKTPFQHSHFREDEVSQHMLRTGFSSLGFACVWTFDLLHFEPHNCQVFQLQIEQVHLTSSYSGLWPSTATCHVTYG